MQKLIALSTLFLLATSSIATAASITIAVEPNRVVETGLQFNVERQGDRHSNQSEFTVDITAKHSSLPEADAAIRIVEVEPTSFSSTGGRRVDCTAEAAIMHCVFTVSDQELQNPNLSFVLTIPVRVEQQGEMVVMPSMNLLYLRLSDRQIRVVNDSTSLSTAIWNALVAAAGAIAAIL